MVWDDLTLEPGTALRRLESHCVLPVEIKGLESQTKGFLTLINLGSRRGQRIYSSFRTVQGLAPDCFPAVLKYGPDPYGNHEYWILVEAYDCDGFTYLEETEPRDRSLEDLRKVLSLCIRLSKRLYPTHYYTDFKWENP